MTERHVVERIVSTVGSWPDVEIQTDVSGITRFVVAGREIAHLHASGTLDVATTYPIRNQLLTDGVADRHHLRPRSSWVSYRVRSRSDVFGGVRLVGLAYLCRLLALENRAARHGRRFADSGPSDAATTARADPVAEFSRLGLSRDLAHLVSRTYHRPLPA